MMMYACPLVSLARLFDRRYTDDFSRLRTTALVDIPLPGAALEALHRGTGADTSRLCLDLQHHIFQLTFDGKLFMSPAGKDKQALRVLDVGTGTGIWAMDYGA